MLLLYVTCEWVEPLLHWILYNSHNKTDSVGILFFKLKMKRKLSLRDSYCPQVI